LFFSFKCWYSSRFNTVDYLVVAGGGGGGYDNGGGGGAGGYRESSGTSSGCYTASPLAINSFTSFSNNISNYSRWRWFSRNLSSSRKKCNGSNSVFSTITSTGGGGGGG
jgi:hypothetical protein